jgi:acetyltransferase-like isoleucine patch superfamily enzyme
MPNLSDRIRDWLREFIGLNPLCTMPKEAMSEHLAHQLLYTPRVFGNRDRVHLGEGVVLNDVLINTSSGSVRLESFSFCGHGVSLLTGTHDYRQLGRERQVGVPPDGRDIVVGEGAWLGSNVTVLGPCTIGAHAVIAAGSVVVGDVEPMTIYGGVPARKLKDIEASCP